MSEKATGPLAGMRVLDCATEIAGPYAAKLLVEGGADVLGCGGHDVGILITLKHGDLDSGLSICGVF